ncbi:MAG TPA: cytochrome c [Bacteroidota bacterium]|nr:cytochrome c [Bacteroidota bacterium]
MKDALMIVAGCILLSCLALEGCTGARKSEPFGGPLSVTDEHVENGRDVFMKDCNKCHPLGESGLGPALNNKWYLPSFMIRFQVRHGLGAMPSFPRNRIPNQELDDLIDYLKAMRKRKQEGQF